VTRLHSLGSRHICASVVAPVRIEVMDNWNRNTTFDSNIGSHFKEHERNVRRDFWSALKHFAGRLPFVEELVAAYYCALDPATPMRVRGILLAALAYFVVRWRYRPLNWLWRLPGLGFTDDAAVLTALFGLSSHITPVHRAAAARALGKEIRRT
jgi:uncharacterized membrane protein YkvA (DUF1232 family)